MWRWESGRLRNTRGHWWGLLTRVLEPRSQHSDIFQLPHSSDSESYGRDLILLATGAWDCYGACDAAEAAIRAAIWTKSFTSQFPRALVAAATLSTCWIPFEPRAKAWNAKFQSLNLEADPRVAILDRAPLTPPTPPGDVHKTNGQVDCEGWHMYNGIAVQNTQSVLRGVCHGKLI